MLSGVILTSGCAVTPEVKQRETVPFHGNEENGGIIDFTSEGALEVDQEFVETYNELIRKYGKMMVPEVTENFGVAALEDGNFSMSLEAIEKCKQLKDFHQYMQKLERTHNL